MHVLVHFTRAHFASTHTHNPHTNSSTSCMTMRHRVCAHILILISFLLKPPLTQQLQTHTDQVSFYMRWIFTVLVMPVCRITRITYYRMGLLEKVHGARSFAEFRVGVSRSTDSHWCVQICATKISKRVWREKFALCVYYMRFECWAATAPFIYPSATYTQKWCSTSVRGCVGMSVCRMFSFIRFIAIKTSTNTRRTNVSSFYFWL